MIRTIAFALFGLSLACGAQAMPLGPVQNDRARSCAYPILGGKQWVVHLVQCPGRSDPLMEDREAAKA
jgi:hypothetical protein